MGRITEEQRALKKNIYKLNYFDALSEVGFYSKTTKKVEEAGGNYARLYAHYGSVDKVMTESTAYSLQIMEEEILETVPDSVEELWEYIDTIPYTVLEKYGKKILLAYQVYTFLKYYRWGKEFFDRANERYIEYGAELEVKLGIPQEKIVPLMFILARACADFVLFGNEECLQAQLFYLKESLKLFFECGFKTEEV